MGRATPQFVTLLAALACVARPGLPTVQEQSTDARILVIELPESVRVDIQSAGGIGRATLTRSGRSWPLHVVLRLHLKGLEGLELVAGRDTVRRSEPTSAGPSPSGWYDVTVPAELLAGQSQVRVQWVDFYR
jgi:hypothetical protein